MSWQTKSNGDLEIYFNRDEYKKRAPGSPPQIFNDGQYLCPIDEARGGTWFAANQYGLAVGLLNLYHQPFDYKKKVSSRGLLVRRLAEQPDIEAARQYLEREVKNQIFAPFTLLLWTQQRTVTCEWAGGTLSPITNVEPLVTSSSWETKRVEEWRRSFYEQKVVNGSWESERFHRHEVEGDRESSVCMSRDTTQTVSLTICRMSNTDIEMEYFAREIDGYFSRGENVKIDRLESIG